MRALNLKDNKQDFYRFGSKLHNRFVKITPLPVLKFIHRKLYEHDNLVQKVENVLEPISDVYFKVKRPFSNLSAYLKSVPSRLDMSIDYARFAWNSNEFDYSSIYSLLEFKLTKMEGVIRGGHHLTSDMYADQIKLVRDIFSLLRSNKLDYISHSFLKSGDFKGLSGLNTTRRAVLRESGALMIVETFDTLDDEETLREKHKKLYSLTRYQEELETAILRVAFHIMTPNHGTYKKVVEEENKRIQNEFGISFDFWENHDMLKHDHKGILGWWD